MYVDATVTGLVFVGDRANDWVVVFDATNDYEVKKLIPVGKGSFHTCSDESSTFLWHVNDIDKTITVIDTVALVAIKTIDLPHDLTRGGGKPHDVTITFDGKFAFVTFIGVEGEHDAVVKYDTKTFEEVARNDKMARDPHVTSTFRSNNLFVAQQGGDVVSILSQEDLKKVDGESKKGGGGSKKGDSELDIPIPDAHGTLMSSQHDKVLYITDISDAEDGERGIYAIDINPPFEVLGSVKSTSATVPPVPHNVAGTGKL